MTAVLEGSSVSVKTMSDGTLRLSIDIEPRNAQAAFALFGAPGRAVALAALKDGAAAKSGEPPVASLPHEAPKGGQWAKQAGMWCADSDFWAFLGNRGYSPKSPEEAAECVRSFCEIGSRAELDHDPEALARYNDRIRHPFMKYMQARGISK